MQTVQLVLGNAQARLDAGNPRLYIGRDPSACGLVSQDPSISRRHAEIFVESGYTYLRDLGSSNGTWVNGQLVGGQPVPLQPGQQVYLGMVPLGVTWVGGGGGATVLAMQMPPELKALIEQRKQMAAMAPAMSAAPTPINVAAGSVPVQAMAPAPMAAPAAAPAPAPAGLGVGGKAAPLPAEFAYRRQGSNDNGVLLIALRQDTFANGMVVDGFLEFTATDNETVASIIIDLVEVHRKGHKGGHVWDRMLVRQGPWRTQKGDVLPLPFQLRIPPGTSISGRDVYWELRGYVDINWASDIEATAPINMRNTDIERIRDGLGALDYRIVDIESIPLGQRFTGRFQPPANLKKDWGISDINLEVEYLGTNLKVVMEVEKTSLFKFDKKNETIFDLARFRAAPLTEISANFKAQIDQMMAK
jgi:hypothetical protein